MRGTSMVLNFWWGPRKLGERDILKWVLKVSSQMLQMKLWLLGKEGRIFAGALRVLGSILRNDMVI
jgi:hypothetical protein